VKTWCLTQGPDAEYVARMEALLELYARPPDPQRPVVCVDESGKELQDHARPPRPPRPGTPSREDSHYIRHGSANLFLWTAPWLGQRGIAVTAQRTAIDWAHAMRDLVDHFPQAEQIDLVLDNLNTHRLGSLYAAFPPAEASRIRRKLTLHYTPVHGSWLNIAELEFSALARQCLDRRIPDATTLQHEIDAWVGERNDAAVQVNWHFTTAEARVKLRHLYPVPENDK
jgi:DDE superfamily endonuclease